MAFRIICSSQCSSSADDILRSRHTKAGVKADDTERHGWRGDDSWSILYTVPSFSYEIAESSVMI